MLSFLNDYSEGGHPKVMEDLMKTNQDSTVGYGFDPYCEKAREIIAKKIKQEAAETWFFAGGTLTNLTVIAHALKPHQAVITAFTGHINVHETGAIEATGHKVLALPSEDGKVTPKDRKSTRLNSSHANISYAVFCLKKKNTNNKIKY